MPTKGKYLAVWGLIFQAGYIFGIVVSIIGMLRAFPQLADATTIASQVALAADISLSLYATAIGITLGIVGAVLLCAALFGVKYRASWFKTAMWIMSVVWILTSPIGIILGIFVMFYLSKHNNDFTKQGGPGNPPQSVGSPDVRLDICICI